MPPSLTRLALLSFCLLPALGAAVPTRHANVVASFIYSCDASDPDPRLRTKWTAPGRPKARPKSSPVEVFQHGEAPARTFVRLGDVNVLASGSRTSVDELTDWAKRGARQLGGDAIVDVSCDDAAHVQPKAGPVGLLYLTATVVRWE
jgi:hypothetical protein